MVPVLVASWRRASRLLQRGKCCRTRTVGPVGPWGHSSVSANFGTLWPCVMAVALSTVGPGRAAGNMAAVRLNRGSQHLSTEFHRNEPQDITRYTMLTLVLMRNNPSTLYALLKWKKQTNSQDLAVMWNLLKCVGTFFSRYFSCSMQGSQQTFFQGNNAKGHILDDFANGQRLRSFAIPILSASLDNICCGRVLTSPSHQFENHFYRWSSTTRTPGPTGKITIQHAYPMCLCCAVISNSIWEFVFLTRCGYHVVLFCTRGSGRCGRKPRESSMGEISKFWRWTDADFNLFTCQFFTIFQNYVCF